MMDEPAYVNSYRQLLEFCITVKSRLEIEGLLWANPVLEHPKAYLAYFIDRLETAGGMEWTGSWMTTEDGVHILES